jgi:hypothetical protein
VKRTFCTETPDKWMDFTNKINFSGKEDKRWDLADGHMLFSIETLQDSNYKMEFCRKS